jgi:hypothetical protein
VVAVGVGQPDPADIGRVDHVGEESDEGAVGQPEAGVDDDRLGGVNNECVHRHEADARNRQAVGQDADVGARGRCAWVLL